MLERFCLFYSKPFQGRSCPRLSNIPSLYDGPFKLFPKIFIKKVHCKLVIKSLPSSLYEREELKVLGNVLSDFRF